MGLSAPFFLRLQTPNRHEKIEKIEKKSILGLDDPRFFYGEVKNLAKYNLDTEQRVRARKTDVPMGLSAPYIF